MDGEALVTVSSCAGVENRHDHASRARHGRACVCHRYIASLASLPHAPNEESPDVSLQSQSDASDGSDGKALPVLTRGGKPVCLPLPSEVPGMGDGFRSPQIMQALDEAVCRRLYRPVGT